MNATKQVNQGPIQVKKTPLPKQLVVDYSPLGLKKKGKQKCEVQPMVLLTAETPEKIAQYSINLPSGSKDTVLDEMDMLKNITVHLNQIVQTMELVYTKDDKIEEEKKEEEETLPDGDDMMSFLIFCSQLNNQLETALREEKQILESLLKWFEKEVQMLEELGEEEIIPDSQVPVADKNITDNINKLINRIQRLEDLKGRVQELPRYIRTSTPRERRRPLAQLPTIPKDPKNIIEELAMKHASEDVMNMVQVFQDDSGAPQTIESLNSRMIEIMKIFERQTNKLHRVTNEQDVLEGKLQKIQQEFQKLAEEKEIMEDELQKMRTSDLPMEKTSADSRKKLLAKLEKQKRKVEEKTGAQPDKGKKPVGPQKVKESEAVKMKEDLVKAQANIQSLEREKKLLEEKLQHALEEANMAKGQLAEVPPGIPDWEFPYTAVDEKDLSKKGKKGLKPKDKGEDRIDMRQASVTDGTVQKTRKGQEISTAPPAKDGKTKKKGTDMSETERGSLHKVLSGVSEKLPKPGKSESPSKTDIKGLTKPKDSAEMKKRRSAMKGTGKEPYDSGDTAVPPLPPDQQEQHLPDSTDQQAESVRITSEKQKEELPAMIPSVDLQKEESSLVIEPESAGLVTSLLAEPEEFMGESASLEKASALSRAPLVTWADSTGFQGEIKDLIDEGMLQLLDHLTELEGMPEAESLAKLLLQSSKGMEALSDTQKLQLISQLIAPDGQVQIPAEDQNVEQREKKRSILASIASTLNLLDQTQSSDAGQTVEEVNEMAKMRRILLADLESSLKDLQQAPAIVPSQEKIEKEINELTQKRSLLISALALNLKDLKEAQAIAANQPSEMSKNKVKELLKERAALNACLEENQQDLQKAKSQEATLAREVKHEEEVNELSEKRKTLLAELEQNLNDLQEAQALAALEPSSMNDEKIKELTEQRNLLAARLETNLQELQRAQTCVPELAEESRLKQEEVNELTERRKSLLASLKSNLKDLQEAQALAAIEPSAMNDEKVKELTEQRKLLTASLETNLQDLRRAQGYVPSPAEESRLKEMELNEHSEKKRLLQGRLESNLKELEEAQILAATEPSAINELKLQELIEERKSLTTELEAAMHVIEGIQRGKELNELSGKKQLLLKKLELNLKDLKAAQDLAAAEPGSMTDNKLQELAEQRRHLAADLEATLQHIEEVQQRDEIVKTPEVELQELSNKKQSLLKKLESNLKELQQMQASAEPGSISEQKLQELTEQRRQLTAELESTVLDMQEIQHRSEPVKPREKDVEKEVHKLLEKKQLLLENLVSNFKELQEIQAVAAAQPESISEHRLQELKEKGRRLTEALEVTVHDIRKAQRRSSGKAEPVIHEKELYDLSVKKQIVLENLKSNLKEVERVQALVGSEPDSFHENIIQRLNDKRKLLSASLDSIIHHIKEIEAHRALDTTKMTFALKRDWDDLCQKKEMFLASLESNLKDLQEAQRLASTHPDSITEQKVQELTEQRRLLAAGLEAIIQDIEDVEYYASDKDAIIKTREVILGELFQRQRLFVENLESNLKALQQVQALAATHPGSMSENKVNELTEQRRLLAAGLEAILQDIQDVQEFDGDKLEMLKIIEGELVKLSDNRRQLWENVELNLKDLQDLALTEPGSMQEEKKQVQRKLLVTNLEALLEAMDEAISLDLHGGEMTSPDEGNINYLFEIKKLESKLDEIQQIRNLSDVQLDNIKRKLCELKQKRGLDRQDVSLKGPLSLTKEELAIFGLDDKSTEKLPEKKRHLCSSPYLQKSIRDMQQRSLMQLGAISDRELYKPVRDKSSLEECLTSIPLQVSEDDITEKYGPEEEQLAKRRLLAAKLEANMKDLHAYYEAQQMRKAQDEDLAAGPSFHRSKSPIPGLQLQISKVPEIKKAVPHRDISIPTVSEVEPESSPIQLQKYKMQQKEMELALRRQFMQQVKKTSLPSELSSHKININSAVREILDSNKDQFSAHRANLPQAHALAQSELRQANLIAAQKLLYSQPTTPNISRFHEYSVQPPRTAWDGYQLPTRDYVHKLLALKKKLFSPEMKELLDFSSLTAQAQSSTSIVEKTDSMLICGKGYKGSKHRLALSHKH